MGHGYSTCPGAKNHPHLHTDEIRVCWYCDRCPNAHNFKLGKGDYCPDCAKEVQAEGLVYSDFYDDYVSPERAAERSG